MTHQKNGNIQCICHTLTVTERDDLTHTKRGGTVLPMHFIIGVFDAYRLKLT